MPRLLVDGILKPGAAILFLLGFGLPLVYFGFQSVEILGERTSPAAVRITLTRTQLFGLVSARRTAEDVDAVTETSVDLPRPVGPRGFLQVTNVALHAGGSETLVFLGSTNASEDLKRRVARELAAFVEDTHAGAYRGTFAMRSPFGWLGLPFLVLGLYGLIRWPWLFAAARKGQHGARGRRRTKGRLR
mgnify:CR=1 FL=1|jgi:hypothetical protein